MIKLLQSSGQKGYFGNRHPAPKGRRPHGRRPDGRRVVEPKERENNRDRDSGCSGLLGCLLNGGSGSGILGGSGGLDGLLGGGRTTRPTINTRRVNNGGGILGSLGGGGGSLLSGIGLGGGLSSLIGK